MIQLENCPYSPQPEKACAAMKAQHSQKEINKIILKKLKKNGPGKTELMPTIKAVVSSSRNRMVMEMDT